MNHFLFMSTTICERLEHISFNNLAKDKRAQAGSNNSAPNQISTSMPPTNMITEPASSPDYIESIESEIPPGQDHDLEMVCGHSLIPELVTDQSHRVA
jgi:hypothetical protein